MDWADNRANSPLWTNMSKRWNATSLRIMQAILYQRPDADPRVSCDAEAGNRENRRREHTFARKSIEL